jgi:hypothetical protein
LFVPKTKIYNSYSPAWANTELRNLIIKKKCAYKKYKLSTFIANYTEFSELRKKCKKLNQISHDQYISDLENSLQINIKPFWNYVNSLKKTKNNVPDCMNYNNVTLLLLLSYGIIDKHYNTIKFVRIEQNNKIK